MIVAITGVSGFIGEGLARHLIRHGVRVRGTSSNKERLAKLNGVLEVSEVMGLSSPIPEALFRECDVVVHCMHDFGRNRLAENVNSMARIRIQLKKLDVGRQIFISSHSARPNALTSYGQIKYAIEQQFLAAGETVVRPGLVIGPGGLFARQERMILKMPWLLLPEGGRGPVYCIHFDDLCQAMQVIMQDGANGAFNLFTPTQPSMKSYVSGILAAHDRTTPLIIPLPTSWLSNVSALLRTVTNIHVEGLARIECMHLNVRNKIHASNLPSLLPVWRRWENGDLFRKH